MKTNKIAIYEVVRIIDKRVLFFDDHLERIKNSAKLIGIELYLSKKEIKQRICELIETSQKEIGNIKFIFNFEEKQNTTIQDFEAFFIEHKYPSKEDYTNGVSTDLLFEERENPNAKITDTNTRKLANQFIKENNIYDAILVNQENEITEGSRSNLFFIKEKTVFTSPLKNVLGGITRQKVIEICEDKKINFIEKSINQNNLNYYDAVFLTGTSPQVLPIYNIGNIFFDTKNKILTKIMLSFQHKISMIS